MQLLGYALSHTIGAEEIIWTIFCSLALAYNLKITRTAAADLVALKMRRINSIREYAARTTLVAFGLWSMVQLLFVLIGIVSLIRPERNAADPLTYSIMVGFILVSFILAVGTFLVERLRQRLIEMIAEIEEDR